MARNRKIIDRGMIEQFAEALSTDKARRVFYMLSDIVDNSAMEISQINSLVNDQNVDFFETGDVLTNTLLPMSELDYYLSIRSAQIELNSIGRMENRFRVFWNKLKAAWKNRKRKSARALRRQQKKLKKAGLVITEKQLLEKKEKPYDLNSLKSDFFDALAEKLTNMTVIYNKPENLRILARDEFGFRINIYPVIKHDDYFRIWNNQKGKFVEIKPLEAKKLLEEKAQEIAKINNSNLQQDADILYKVIRIFKSLFYNLKQSYDYQFVESLIYSCPNSLFKIEEDEHYVYNIFLKVLNYLNNSPISQIRSIYNDEKTIYQQDQTTVYNVKTFLKDIQEYLG